MGSKLLIVDDETSIADLMRDALEIEGFEAYAVYSGNQAIEFLAKREVDLVVSDVRMPDGDGLFLLRSISSMANPPKVVFITGQSEYSSQNLIEQGASKVYFKPLLIDKFISEVKTILA